MQLVHVVIYVQHSDEDGSEPWTVAFADRHHALDFQAQCKSDPDCKSVFMTTLGVLTERLEMPKAPDPEDDFNWVGSRHHY